MGRTWGRGFGVEQLRGRFNTVRRQAQSIQLTNRLDVVETASGSDCRDLLVIEIEPRIVVALIGYRLH
jgi:hypothetical protein